MLKKALLGTVALVGLLLVVGFAYVEVTYRRDFGATPLPALAASTDPAVIARGEYVANAIAHCPVCHSFEGTKADWRLRPRHDLRGGGKLEAGPFGTYYPSNLTPDPETGIGRLSDGQLARTIKTGVRADGSLSPIMALSVGNLADEDVVAVISYLRSVPPVKSAVPPGEWGILAKAFSSKLRPALRPPIAYVASGTASVARGEYLANGPGFCVGCHSPFDLGAFQYGAPHFSGEAMAEPDPTDEAFEFVAPNLTPDPETGHIAGWSEDAFVARFRSGRAYKGSKMPWEAFVQMTEADLRSLYRYLKTVPPARSVIGPSRRPAGWTPPG